jgi:hypothetical protein
MVMDAIAKGARYAKIFRKAGALLNRDRIAQAVKVLEEGRTFAEEQGDGAMARRFEREMERVRGVPGSPDD